jgi:hypothetical protein
MKKNRLAFVFISALFSFFLIRCSSEKTDKDICSLNGLSYAEKNLVCKLIATMNKEKIGKEPLENFNSETFYYIKFLDSVREDKVKPISDEYAAMLRNNYDTKRIKIERLYVGQMQQSRNEAGRMEEHDACSVWIPIDDFAPFFGQLLDREIIKDTKVGMKIVFGSYPYDSHDATFPDSTSGRSTVYFVGTYDTIPHEQSYFVTRHKEIKDLSIPVPVKGGFQSQLNHGTLCPDSCTAP